MILASAILLAVQSAPPPTAERPNFALPFATGQLVMSYLDGPPHCRAEGRGAFVEPARHVCERIEPMATTAAPLDPPAHVLGGMIVEVQRDGQTARFTAMAECSKRAACARRCFATRTPIWQTPPHRERGAGGWRCARSPLHPHRPARWERILTCC